MCALHDYNRIIKHVPIRSSVNCISVICKLVKDEEIKQVRLIFILIVLSAISTCINKSI